MCLTGDHLLASSRARVGQGKFYQVRKLIGSFAMSDDDAKQAEDDYDGFSVGTLFGRTFLEKLLMAIIDAHPVGQDTSETRLKVAVRALTGENSKAEAYRGRRRKADPAHS